MAQRSKVSTRAIATERVPSFPVTARRTASTSSIAGAQVNAIAAAVFADKTAAYGRCLSKLEKGALTGGHESMPQVDRGRDARLLPPPLTKCAVGGAATAAGEN